MFSRIFSAARSSHSGDGDRRQRRGGDMGSGSATTTHLSTPISMYSAVSPGDDDDHAAALLAMSEGGTPRAMPVALSPPSQLVVVALDATRDHSEVHLRMALRALVARGDMLRGGDSLVVLCVLHAITNPMRYQTKVTSGSFAGTSVQYLRDQIGKKVGYYREKLLKDVEELRKVGISVTLKVSPGSPAKVVIIQELNSSNAAWVVIDRHFKRDFKYLEKHIACKVAAFQDNLSVQTRRSIRMNPSSKVMGEVKDLEHLVVSIDLSSKTLGSSMQDFKPSMSVTSITMVNETNALDAIGEEEGHNTTRDEDDGDRALHA